MMDREDAVTIANCMIFQSKGMVRQHYDFGATKDERDTLQRQAKFLRKVANKIDPPVGRTCETCSADLSPRDGIINDDRDEPCAGCTPSAMSNWRPEAPPSPPRVIYKRKSVGQGKTLVSGMKIVPNGPNWPKKDQPNSGGEDDGT